MSKTTNRFAPEVRHRAVRMVRDQGGEHPSRWAMVVSLASKIGISETNLSLLKSRKVRGLCFSKLDTICRYLDGVLADILE